MVKCAPLHWIILCASLLQSSTPFSLFEIPPLQLVWFQRILQPVLKENRSSNWETDRFVSKNWVMCYGLVVVNVKKERDFWRFRMLEGSWRHGISCQGGGDQRALTYDLVTPWTEGCAVFISTSEKTCFFFSSLFTIIIEQLLLLSFLFGFCIYSVVLVVFACVRKSEKECRCVQCRHWANVYNTDTEIHLRSAFRL